MPFQGEWNQKVLEESPLNYRTVISRTYKYIPLKIGYTTYLKYILTLEDKIQIHNIQGLAILATFQNKNNREV